MRKALLSLAVVAIGLGGFAAYLYGSYGSAETQRSDCPGKVVCPLTGEEVCKDQCPLIDASRGDCPGKIECSLTGELICRDECPVETSPEGEAAAGASCCAGCE